jgi:hypothetical protein
MFNAPDPALFVSDRQDAKKFFFCLSPVLFESTFSSFFTDKKKSHKKVTKQYQ